LFFFIFPYSKFPTPSKFAGEGSARQNQIILSSVMKSDPAREDREFILLHFGRGLSGVSEVDQVNLGLCSRSFVTSL